MRIAYVHPDAEGREEQVAQNIYPKNQLWGFDLLKEQGHEIVPVPTKANQGIAAWFGRLLDKLTKNRLGDFLIEFQVLRHAGKADIIYAPSGHFFLLPLLRRLGLLKAKLVTLFFRLPDNSAWWNLRGMRFTRYVLNGFDGILCLTKQAENNFQQRTNDISVRYLPWFADPDIFHSSEVTSDDEGYFLCVGKTRRDYPTLLKACAKVDIQFRIIAPKESAQGTPIPANVQFIETSQDPPDAAISYPELHDWYAGAHAVLIPLMGDPSDTSGYTTLLEAMAMGKPILMTQSGCLDIDIEELGIGYTVPPGDDDAWIKAIQSLEQDAKRVKTMGHRSRQVAQTQFSPTSFRDNLNRFLKHLK